MQVFVEKLRIRIAFTFYKQLTRQFDNFTFKKQTNKQKTLSVKAHHCNCRRNDENSKHFIVIKDKLFFGKLTDFQMSAAIATAFVSVHSK